MTKLKILFLVFVTFFASFIAIISEEPSNTREERDNSSRNNKKDITDPELLRRLELNISRLRGLEFKKELKVGIKNKDELKSKMQEQVEKETSEEYEKIRKALVKLGFISPDLNLRQFMIDLYTEQIAGFYDPQEKELYLVPARDKSAEPPDTLGIMWSILATVHEMTHALQDQNFDLTTLPMDEMDNDDMATAVKSLVEGEASFLMYDYALRQRGLDMVLLPPDVFEASDPTPFSNRSLIDRAPIYIKEGLVFPYTKGLEFIKFVKARGGWEAVNKIYSDLPSSSEQIIHPEKYFIERDYPMTITIPDTTKVLTTSQWTLLLDNVMGELNIAVLKKQFFPTFTSKRMSEGWGGDRFILWEDQIDKHVLLVWFTTWDTENDSREFYNAYQKLITKKYNGSNSEFPKALIQNKEQNYILWKLERQINPLSNTDKTLIKTNMISIEQRGLDVMVIEDIPDKLLEPFSKTIWTNIERKEMKEVRRITPPQKKEEDNKKKKTSEENSGK